MFSVPERSGAFIYDSEEIDAGLFICRNWNDRASLRRRAVAVATITVAKGKMRNSSKFNESI